MKAVIRLLLQVQHGQNNDCTEETNWGIGYFSELWHKTYNLKCLCTNLPLSRKYLYLMSRSVKGFTVDTDHLRNHSELCASMLVDSFYQCQHVFLTVVHCKTDAKLMSTLLKTWFPFIKKYDNIAAFSFSLNVWNAMCLTLCTSSTAFQPSSTSIIEVTLDPWR